MDQSNYKPVFINQIEDNVFEIMLSFRAKANEPDTGHVHHTILASTGANWEFYEGTFDRREAISQIEIGSEVNTFQQMARIKVLGKKPTNVPLRIRIEMPNGESDGEMRMLFIPKL
jgi:hypothetical protein